ncbi:hypothetical protein [Maribacter halichondriae]|nr:hypothetical protein [Maribacter sp. Hal144]
MDLPNEIYDIVITIGLVAAGIVLVTYLTRKSRNFRSSRNKKARKQHPY